MPNETMTRQSIRIEKWRPNRGALLAESFFRPLIHLLNRPAMSWAGNLLYDFALRCNGIANSGGKHGLSRAEERFLKSVKGKLQSGTLFDVGANAGGYSRFLRRLAPDSRIYAFEPHPKTFANMQRNTAEENITAVNKALSDAPGTTKLYDFGDNDGSVQASLDASAINFYSSNVVSHDVECTTLDHFMADEHIDRIDLLKIDTEGFDLAVLKGARHAIAARKIGMIQFEFIPANVARRIFMKDFFETLHGYTIHRMCTNGQLISLEPYSIKRCEIFITQNLVALPKT